MILGQTDRISRTNDPRSWSALVAGTVPLQIALQDIGHLTDIERWM